MIPGDLSAEKASPTKNSKCFRLIVNIDIFTADFKTAVEAYLADVEKMNTRVVKLYSKSKKKVEDVSVNVESNLMKALTDYPVETVALFELS